MRSALIEVGGEVLQARVEGEGYRVGEGDGVRRLRMDEVRLLPPTVPSKILAVGWNFSEHIREMSGALPSTPAGPPPEPNIFYKPPSSLVAHREDIVYPREAGEVHYEAELAVVVGRPLRRAGLEECRRAVRGWTCANDVTERAFQRTDKQWWRAKGFDTFCPLGPWLVQEEPPASAAIRSFVNGELRQDGRVGDMLLGPYEILSYVSQALTLLPGDVVLLGTPPGVGAFLPGDVVRIEVEGVGVLENRVVAEPA